MATARKKTAHAAAAKKPVSRRSAKRPTAKRRTKSSVSPIITASPAPVVTPVTQPVVTPPEPSLKHVPDQPGSRLKLWLAVSASMAVVVLIWAYMLSQSVLTSNVVEESLATSDIDEFVNSIEQSLSDLKTESSAVDVTAPTTTATQPTPTELDNLFSDIE